MVALFDPLEFEISGIIQVEDIDKVAELMENNTTAAFIAVRKPVGDQVRRSRAQGEWPDAGARTDPLRGRE